jgi:hypothetical protein
MILVKVHTSRHRAMHMPVRGCLCCCCFLAANKLEAQGLRYIDDGQS